MENNKTLFLYQNKPVTVENIKQGLQDAGVHSGDLVLVHSSLSTFGKLAGLSKEGFLSALAQAFIDVVGPEGTLVIPTFTDSFAKGQLYDVDNTPSYCGILTEHFRKRTDTIRTSHPTHSVAVWGKHKDVFDHMEHDAYGKGSFLETVYKNKGKIVYFGLPLRQAFTFVHYLEQCARVPYRYTTQLNGTIVKEGKTSHQTLTTYARYPIFFNSNARFEDYLKSKNLVKEVIVGSGVITCFDANVLFEQGMSKLKEDSFYFTYQDTSKQRLLITLLKPFLVYTPWLTRLGNMIGVKIVRFVRRCMN